MFCFMKKSSVHYFILALGLVVASACESDLASVDQSGISNPSGSAINSSYARILTVGDYMYAVNLTELVTFDISNRANPTEIHRQDAVDGVESLFHIDSVLLIGSTFGTLTYSIDADGIPRRRGQLEYNTLDLPVAPCDPVVAQNEVAYATLYTAELNAGPCGRDLVVNLLVVMDISDLENPSVITSVETPSPRGLAIDGDYLFVCNDWAGLTVYNVNDPSRPTVVSRIEDITTYDVVANNGNLIVVGEDQLLQYDYADPSNLVLHSTIKI
jgi:hypothetical protein